MNERSIFRMSTGNWRRYASDEYPVPKSSIATLMPSALTAVSWRAVASASRMIAVSVISMTSADGSSPVSVRVSAEILDEVLVVELARRDIDGDVHVPRRQVPLDRLAARFGQYPAPDVDDLVGLLEQRDEGVGLHHAARRVVPAQEGLDAEHATALEVEDRLVHEEELAAFRRRPGDRARA